ncbi:hypothetical protein BDN67DRAFT_1017665 [Paxillus ammoniavirescens]|nr:hypothetical protein BDN67DRAFT_1017665 [Paxillus ammoniavirescens]
MEALDFPDAVQDMARELWSNNRNAEEAFPSTLQWSSGVRCVTPPAPAICRVWTWTLVGMVSVVPWPPSTPTMMLLWWKPLQSITIMKEAVAVDGEGGGDHCDLRWGTILRWAITSTVAVTAVTVTAITVTAVTVTTVTVTVHGPIHY